MNMIPMALTDLLFLIIILICAFRGYFRGAYREIVPLITWITANFLCISYSQQLADIYLRAYFTHPVAIVIAELFLIIVVLFIGWICAYGLKVILIGQELSTAKRILGLLASFMRGVFISLLIVHVVDHTHFSQKKGWHKSYVVQVLAPWLTKIDNDIYESTTIDYSPISKIKDT